MRKRSGRREGQPHDVAAIRAAIRGALETKDESKRVASSAKCGVYAFFDYDGEPIYVGQTFEQLRVRILRHLTNQRTDAVAMNVLDPFEVAEIEMWPFFDIEGLDTGKKKELLNSAEYTVYQQVVRKSIFKAVLNEVEVPAAPIIRLPKSVRCKIIPAGVYERRKHADVRIARRASTIANLARVISERSVQPGLRKTLLTQAKRLEYLARNRYEELAGMVAEGGDEDRDSEE